MFVTVIFHTFFCQIITTYQYVKCLVKEIRFEKLKHCNISIYLSLKLKSLDASVRRKVRKGWSLSLLAGTEVFLTKNLIISTTTSPKHIFPLHCMYMYVV